MAKYKRVKTQFPGVRYRVHPSRKHGVNADRYFTIRYRVDGKAKEEGLGWATEGMTAKKASVYLAKLKEAHLTGEGAQTLAEKRNLAKSRREKEQAEKEQNERDALTFGQYFWNVYFPCAQTNKKKASYDAEKYLFTLWIEPVIGSSSFKQIKPFNIESIKSRMIKAGKSAASIRYAFAVIRQVWNMAKPEGISEGDSPTKQVKLPRVDNRRARFLSHEEAKVILNELAKSSHQLHNIAFLSLYTGMRAGEIFNLAWDCVDLERKTILLKDTKSGRNRTAYMTDKVASMLAGRRDATNVYVFKTRNGEKIKEVSNAFGRVVQKLGFNKGIHDPRDRVVFHTLRHTFASWLVESGVDLYTVKTLLGHQTLAMTERYSHLSQGVLQEAVSKLSRSIDDNSSEKVVAKTG